MAYADIEEGPTYCSVEDVEEYLSLPSIDDPQGIFRFSDVSNPSYSRVEKMILAAEDEIDQRTRRSWRVNYVKDHITSISEYWHDLAGLRHDYLSLGGDFIQLRRNILPWDPEKGDKLEIRMHSNVWRDITDAVDNPDNPTRSPNVWIDYKMGKIYLRTRMYQQKGNAVRVSYRYGSDEPIPRGINELCSLIVASNIVNMGVYDIKVGLGGDIAGIKEQYLARWDDRIGKLYSSFQMPGSVHSLLR